VTTELRIKEIQKQRRNRKNVENPEDRQSTNNNSSSNPQGAKNTDDSTNENSEKEKSAEATTENNFASSSTTPHVDQREEETFSENTSELDSYEEVMVDHWFKT